MIKSYFKIAFRTLTRNLFYATVNIVGLSVGIAFTMIIAAYVWNELRVNKSLRHADSQYIIQSKWKLENQGYEIATFGPLAKALKENYPNLVANYYRYDGITSNVSYGDKHFREGMQVGDSTLLDMYGFSLFRGDIHTALNAPFSAVITKAMAVKYFGTGEALGKTLTIENFSGSKHDFLITGVLNPSRLNSVTHLVDDYPNNIFISTDNLNYFGRNMEWNNAAIAGYIELQKGVSPSDLVKPMELLISKNAPPTTSDNMHPYLVSLNKYYLLANNGVVRKMLYALSAIALFILLMAVINFVNMSVSRSSSRLREIGIRKVMGGVKRQLTIQFIVESVLLVIISTMLALLLYMLCRGLFSELLGKEIPSLGRFPGYFVFIPLLFAVLIGMLSGLYPAFVLASIKAVDSLKGKLKTVKEKIILRKFLIAFQFGTATISFVGAMVISRQTQLFFSQDLGYNKDFMIAAQVPRDWSAAGASRMEAIRSRFAALPQVNNVALSYEIPDGNNSGGAYLYKEGTDSKSAIASKLLITDEYYAGTYGIPMAAGEFFNPPGTFRDSSRLVINETEAKAFGWQPAEAIGKRVKFASGPGVYSIVGVVNDYHEGSMQKTIQPLVFAHVNLFTAFRFFSFKLKPGNIGASLDVLQKRWAIEMPGTPFEYKFLDETLKNMYKTELQLKKASYTATILSIIIVFLGITGLVSLNIRKRTKEIGIRKVLGSSVGNIIALFVKDFLWVIIFAGIIASPVAWWIMQQWLNDYAYRISLNAQPFLVSIGALAILTMLLITIQTFNAGRANPVKSLRTE